MNDMALPRILTILGVFTLALVGLAGLLMFLGGGAAAPAPTKVPEPPASPSPTSTQPPEPVIDDDTVIASVEGRPITYSFWREAVLVDQMMSGLAGQSIPTGEETLQRLINEALVLQAVPPAQRPAGDDVEKKIVSLEQGWGVDDTAMQEALSEAGLERAAFERAIERLLMIESALATLESQGQDVRAWLEEQRARADIQILEETTTLPLVADTSSGTASPSAPEPTEISKTPTEPPATLETAPDFTLKMAGGGQFTLTEQLAEGPVVLVFFQKCG
jgi:hypothetical protein